MKKAELIAMLAQVPDDADIQVSDASDYCSDWCSKLEIYPDGDVWRLVGVFEYAPPPKPVPDFVFQQTEVRIEVQGETFRCTQVGCGSTEFVQFAPAAFKCKACGCVYAAD